MLFWDFPNFPAINRIVNMRKCGNLLLAGAPGWPYPGWIGEVESVEERLPSVAGGRLVTRRGSQCEEE
jgi:hypothetical protein